MKKPLEDDAQQVEEVKWEGDVLVDEESVVSPTEVVHSCQGSFW